jgi:DNA-binding NarL/FixJ family response regulator
MTPSARASGDLEAGRAAFTRRDWSEAFARLSAADAIAPLNIDALEELATAAYLIGNDVALLERAHNEFVQIGENARAVRIAFWIIVDLMTKGEWARGSGWMARARRLLQDSPAICAERGLMLVLDSRVQGAAGDVDAAYASAALAMNQADASADRTLDAFSRLAMAQVRARRGECAEAATLLDEIMVATTAGDVAPIGAGIVYCAMIDTCHQLYDFPRAREWTAAFTHWCSAQPSLVPFRGQCLVHRTEIMCFGGEWTLALEEAERACGWLDRMNDDERGSAPRSFKFPTGAAYYQLGEIHRLRGELADAEQAYRSASEFGYPPEPGLALLRMAQGRLKDAVTAIRRALEQPLRGPTGANVLAAAVEILVAASDSAAAGNALHALEGMTGASNAPYLHALCATCRGRVLLASGDIATALGELRTAWTAWQELDAPYAAARVRMLLARAYLTSGDVDAAELEMDAARRVLQRLEAKTDLARLEEIRPAITTPILTPRELEVIGMVATGKTNLAIARALTISERTVDRHVSNILVKLGLPSRSAATAYAYEHGLVGRM